jgi:predicted AAA+ superfamily ATPase
MKPPICSAAELGSDFDFRRALEIGLIPLIWQSADPQASLAAYATLFLQEEVQTVALVSQIGDLSRLLEVISFSQASQLNLAALAREAAIIRKRAESHFSIPDNLLLSSQLPVFQRRAHRQLVQHHKFFYFDVGVFRALRAPRPH